MIKVNWEIRVPDSFLDQWISEFRFFVCLFVRSFVAVAWSGSAETSPGGDGGCHGGGCQLRLRLVAAAVTAGKVF